MIINHFDFTVIFSAIFLYILGGKKQTVPQTIALAIMSMASVRLAYKRPTWSERKPFESLPEEQVVRKVAESMEGWEGTKGGAEALRPKSPGSSPVLRPMNMNMKPGKAAADTEKKPVQPYTDNEAITLQGLA